MSMSEQSLSQAPKAQVKVESKVKSGLPRRPVRWPDSRRACHDCARPTTDYRCASCLNAWREKHDVWEGLL